ncbi:ankyrin repeat protein [Megavirus baoshan]|uniref:Ankyrin repeat protein n=1 Tax=Megavirus baoshan TaxID=2496520 RepID=A0A3Q8U8R7_9VIRU|nr:ankyrin repeat protein [Megavirus baoshan]AZL89838.1 ankyrin repeat protein [Megavirus baoshan]
MILIFGDSLVDGIKLNCNFHIEKFPGITSEQLLCNYYDLNFYLDEDDYHIVIIVIGSNDLGQNISENNIIDNIISLHKIAWNRNIKTIVVGLSKKFNIFLLKKLNEYDSINYLFCDYLENVSKDKTTDGLHLTLFAKNEFSNQLQELIKKFDN